MTQRVCTCTLLDPYGYPVPNPTCPVHSRPARPRGWSGPRTALVATAILGAIAAIAFLVNRSQQPAVGDCMQVTLSGSGSVVACDSSAATHRIVAVRQGAGFSVQMDCLGLGAKAFEMADGSETLCIQAIHH